MAVNHRNVFATEHSSTNPSLSPLRSEGGGAIGVLDDDLATVTRIDNLGQEPDDCTVVDKDPFCVTEDGAKRKLSIPNISHRHSSDKVKGIRNRPSLSPSFTSFLVPSRIRLPRRSSAQPGTTATLSSLSIEPEPHSYPGSPTMSKPRNTALEAFTNWLAVKPPTPPVDRPSAVLVSDVPEPIPAMLRYPPKDPNEIPHSPDCIDCAHKRVVKGDTFVTASPHGQDESLSIQIGQHGQGGLFRSTDEQERVNRVHSNRFGSSPSLASLASAVESGAKTRPELSISTTLSHRARRPSQLASQASSCIDLTALPESEEVTTFKSPGPSNQLIEEDTSLPTLYSATVDKAITEEPQTVSPSELSNQRVWLCSPPPRSPPLSPLQLDSSSTLNVNQPVPVTMTRSRSEATVASITVEHIQPATFASRWCNKTGRRNRPFVTRSFSTGRLATEFDDQGRVICLSAHSDRVLANKISVEPVWKIKTPIVSEPPTPTSPGGQSPFASVRSRFGSSASPSMKGSKMGRPMPKRANSESRDSPSEFGALNSGPGNQQRGAGIVQ
ncbi:hypothetical protein BD324DRAFT_652982 [Kockovaella imperatae]|uniref:Uncharacterized protein n=1 Tax=Kockovaella imperatae TaxID=4999 RepID=A0A1Y1U9L0_9TREE|nr:hypothetical protein BD324DRAFT_652982 [Kockovaella imperatae]ORX34723.1 hypothetical protein BD324DRAFT_652982 [Kockovaella imperatae]